MTTKPKYKTRQREELLRYLQTMAGEHVTVGEICGHLRAQGVAIGQTTVYRQLERMVDEGLVNKYSIDAGSPACFSYIAPDAHLEEETCFHCRCEKCGKLIHLHCEELAEIAAHLHSEHDFELNPMRTVFYGLCAQCRQRP